MHMRLYATCEWVGALGGQKKEGFGYAQNGVTGDCEQPYMGAGN